MEVGIRIVGKVAHNKRLQNDLQQSVACWFAPRVRGAGV